MSVTLTYDATLSRVRIAATGLGGADTALFERSTDQVRWTTVRGGVDVPVVSSSASLDDYEFSPSVLNYYRVTTAKDITFVSAGTAAHANNASVTPGLPAGAVAGDLLLLLAAIRNTAGDPDTPAGYVMLANLQNMRLYGKIHSGSESAPTVTFTGGVANADTSAQMCAFRNTVGDVDAFAFNYLSASAQNIAYPAVSPVTVHDLVLYFGWKQDDWTSVATIAGATEIGEPTTTTGDDQGIVWDYTIQTSTLPTSVAAGSFTVTGGAAAISTGAVWAFKPALLVQTSSITPTLTEVILKSISRPFLNTPVKVVKNVVVGRKVRNGVFDIVGRSLPVAVTDVSSSRSVSVRLIVDDREQQDHLDLVFASGDPLFLHVPPDYPTPSMYVVPGDVDFDEFLGVFSVPLTEVAPPHADVVGATTTWQGVINQYATWADLIAAEATWQDLIENVGDPTDVIVP